jgi:hypothetical protein
MFVVIVVDYNLFMWNKIIEKRNKQSHNEHKDVRDSILNIRPP